MEKHRAIPDGYMKVGELAKKMGITVRTLQYYDKEGLLSPSSESEGGFRLYTDKDMVKLIQILTMKQLGLTLSDIKSRLVSLDAPDDMVHVLTEHETSIREKIETLSESLREIGALKAEVIQMKTMDFKKYATILLNLQMKNENYWAIKYLDDDIFDHIGNYFGNDKSRALAFIQTMERLNKKAVQLEEDGTSPESEKGQAVAKEFWEMIREFTGGDMNLLPSLVEFAERVNSLDEERSKNFISANHFLQAALDVYFVKLGHDPFE